MKVVGGVLMAALFALAIAAVVLMPGKSAHEVRHGFHQVQVFVKHVSEK